MLVLSRKEAEKVLFPALGITIEVNRVQGKTVRLGIHAPDEIRIIRAELEETDELENRQSDSFANASNTRAANGDIQKCLDTANLAIHLAQNRVRQRLNDDAEEALKDALASLDKLERTVSSQPELSPMPTRVRETKIRYQCNPSKLALAVG